MTIYIATIGDPTNWFASDYVIKRENEEKKIEEAYTTIFTYENISKIILIVNDSVIYARGIRQNPALDCYNRIVSPKNYTQYSDILSIVEDYMKCVMDKFKGDLEKRGYKIEDISQKLKIMVVPAIGTFRKGNMITKFGKIVVKENEVPPARYYPNLLETLLAYSLYEELKGTKEEEVVLDITHGINYLPTLAFNTIYKLVSLLGLKLTVMNFVPVDSRYQNNNEIRIYLRVDVVSTVNKGFTFDIDQIDEDKITDKLNKSIIKALKYNAPLALVYLCKLREQEKKKIEEKGEKEKKKDGYHSQFEDATSISQISDKENEIIIDKEKIKWIEKVDDVWGDIIANFVCDKVNELASKYSCGEGYYNIEILNELAKEVFSRFSSISENIIQNESSNIYNIASEGMKDAGEKMYYELFKLEGTQSDPDRIIRNYIAHAGLLKEILKVKKTKEGKICIKYADLFNYILSAIYGKDTTKSIYDIV